MLWNGLASDQIPMASMQAISGVAMVDEGRVDLRVATIRGPDRVVDGRRYPWPPNRGPIPRN
jgi:hypothetical protein